MHTHNNNRNRLTKILVIIATELALFSPANALDVTSGQFIQTIHSQALFDTSSLTVNDFFDDQSMAGLLRDNIINDVILGPPPLSSHIFTYAVHGPDFVDGHPDRNAGMNSFPSNFSFDPENFIETAGKGRIGLGGVMRFDLPLLDDGKKRFFISGDWTLEYDKTRLDPYDLGKDPNRPVRPEEFGVSGWFMRNHFDFPAVGYEILNETIITNSDSFYMSGELGWTPEMTVGFFPFEALYQVVSDFVLCGQDDAALAANSAKQIPCVFPNITINGQRGTVNIDSPTAMNLAVDLGLATNESYPDADFFAAFVHDNEIYWLNQNFEWTANEASAYQGALFDFRSIAIPAPKLPSGSLPSGATITIYFGVDANQNGVFDQPYRYSSVTMHIN